MFMLGTLPGMIRLDWSLDLTSSAQRQVSVTETLGGSSFAQMSPHTAREWQVSAGHMRTQDVGVLEQLLNSAGVSPLVLVTERAATTNGLTPAQSAFKQDLLPAAVSRGGVEWVRDAWGDWQVAWSALTTLTAAWDLGGPVCPVIGGQPVTISAAFRTMTGQSAMFGVKWVDAAGAEVSAATYPVTATAVAPLVRQSLTLTAPAAAVGVILRFQGVSQVAAPAVTLTDTLTPWDVGDGAPSVVVTGGRSAGMVRTAGPDRYLSYDLTLREVGGAHW